MVVVGRKYWKALALVCLTSAPLPHAANSSDVLRLDSMLRELRKLLCYERHGKLSSDRCKNHGCGKEKPKSISSAIFLASGPLRNAANSSVVPTELPAEPTTKMKSSKANL